MVKLGFLRLFFFALESSQVVSSSHLASAVFVTVALTVTPQGGNARREEFVKMSVSGLNKMAKCKYKEKKN